jgi:uncharacterized protein (TIGR00369 family)
MNDVPSLPNDGLKRPFNDMLGIQVVAMENGTATVTLGQRPELFNALGGVHGGAMASLLDVACAMAIRASAPDIKGSATISLAISFLDTSNGPLTAFGTATRIGRSIAAAEARITDDDGKLVAQAIGSFRMIRGK